MRMTWRLAALLCLCTGAALAQTVELPRLPDGGVDLDKVFPSFHSVWATTENGFGNRFAGELLGAPFRGELQGDPSGESFAILLEAPNFSEEAAFFVAAQESNTRCIVIKRRPGPVQWRETAKFANGRWHVATSCRQEPWPPRPADAK